jgi:hypothetical protein
MRAGNSDRSVVLLTGEKQHSICPRLGVAHCMGNETSCVDLSAGLRTFESPIMARSGIVGATPCSIFR